MSKMMLHDEAAREALGRGVAKLARAVAARTQRRPNRVISPPMCAHAVTSIGCHVESTKPLPAAAPVRRCL